MDGKEEEKKAHVGQEHKDGGELNGHDAPRKQRKRGRLQKGPGTVWNSSFRRKPKTHRRALIQEPWRYPVASQNLAAIEIQRRIRGYLSRNGKSGGGKPPPTGDPGTANLTAAAADALNVMRRKPKLSMREKYELKKLMVEENKLQEEHDKEYDMWCRERIQAWWRMLMVKQEYERNRFSMYHIAAMQIQYLWKAFTREQYMELSKPPARVTAAEKIQNAWRRYTNMRIYRYYRDLIRFRNTGDPALMLRSINPREAALIDRASGLKVRFRLGGTSFPPQIYYKIFTRAPLCDVGAFAPRDYTRERGVTAAQRHNRPTAPPVEGHGPDDSVILDAAIDGGTGMVMTLGQATQVSKLTKFAADSTAAFEAATGGDAAASRTGKGAFASINVGGAVREVYSTSDLPRGWYRRRENNGWRPVSLKSLEEADKDPITRATNRLATAFHYSKVRRREDTVRRRKARKRRWLMKMYKEGLAKERGEAMAGGAGAGAGAGATGELHDVVDMEDEDWESQADDLLKWSDTLDFDQYVADWQEVGTSGEPAAVEPEVGVDVRDAHTATSLLGGSYGDDGVF